MEPYVFLYGDTPWPEGITTLQLYMPVDLALNPDLGELLPRWRAALDGASVGLVQDKHLHVTLVIYSCQANQPVKRLKGCQVRQARSLAGGRQRRPTHRRRQRLHMAQSGEPME